MQYITFNSDTTKTKFKYCILVPQIKGSDIHKEYITPFGIDSSEVVVLSLHKTGKKTPTKVMKEYALELAEAFTDMEVEYIIVGDSDYYKIISGEKKSEANLGYVQTINEGKHHVVFVPNYKQVFYDPDLVRAKIAQSMQALKDHEAGKYVEPGTGIIKHAVYPTNINDIVNELQKLFNKGKPLTCDIEGFDLKHYNAGLGTITFCWNQNEGIAFAIDLSPEPQHYLFSPDEYKIAIREILKDFFIHFPEKIIFHNASYDVTVLIYQLFMEHIEDTAGLLYGLEVFMEKVEDTKLIAYLATNTCAGNTLGLKPLSQEYSGNYSVDEITDITKIPLDELLQYNLVDGLSTWYVYNKYYPIMVADNQETVYREMFLPALVDIIHMQLTGMPICMKTVAEVKTVMEKDVKDALDVLNSSILVQEFVYELKEAWVIKRNSELKVKRVTIDDAPDDLVFNPNSDQQLQKFLFEKLGLPILGTTSSGQPSTKGDVIKGLKKKTSDPEIHKILDAIKAFKDVIIILNTFISAFEKSVQGPSGQYYLYGFFNLGGTVSGRLSSNGPNLQNIPANSKYAKLIKKCFQAFNGWLFVGLDFASLEDRISALTTKDPNKLKVYTDGYDGHCLRAYFYFSDQMPYIDPNSVTSINSIADKYKALRQDSKVPTFLLTYGGTWMGIIDKAGFAEDKAKLIEKKYHEAYVISDQWVQAKLDQAAIDGYVTVAFGLRVRTPLLKQVLRGTKVTPFEAEAEGRTAGNALGQSWGLLNTRAVIAFMKKVRAHPKFRYLIRPCAQIHDANYYIIKDDPELLIWMNENLVKEVQWQDHKDIYHDEVKLGGELSVFFPSWAEEMQLPNELDRDILNTLTDEHINKITKEGVL